jgi:hypothetical protein
MSKSWFEKYRSTCAALAVTALSLIFCLAVTWGWPWDKRGAYSGDGYTNKNIMVSSHNFQRFGFAPLKFIPVQQSVSADVKTADQIPLDLYYTHYPPGPDWIHGALYTIGIRSGRAHQMLQYIVTVLGMSFCWMALAAFFTGWPRVFAYGAALLSCSFVFFADSLQSFSWFFLFIWLYLYLLFTKPRAGAFFALGFISSWFSLDTVIPLQSLALIPLGMALPLKRRLILAAAMPLGEATGFTLHVLHNAWLLGGIPAALTDFFHSYRQRTGVMTNAELELRFKQHESLEYNFARHAVKYVLSLQWFYTLPLVAAATWGWNQGWKKRKPPMVAYVFSACVLGAVIWQIAMKQHSMIHAFTVRHADVFVVLGFGFFAQWALGSRKACVKALPAVLLLALAAHTTLAVARVEGTALRLWATNMLVAPAQRVSWACLQKKRLRNSSELEGAKTVVHEYLSAQVGLAEDCWNSTPPPPPSVAGNIAAFILYIR